MTGPGSPCDSHDKLSRYCLIEQVHSSPQKRKCLRAKCTTCSSNTFVLEPLLRTPGPPDCHVVANTAPAQEEGICYRYILTGRKRPQGTPLKGPASPGFERPEALVLDHHHPALVPLGVEAQAIDPHLKGAQ